MTQSDLVELKAIIHRSRWTLEELTVDQKDQEANELLSGSAKGMVAYLVGRFGSVGAVIRMSQGMRRSKPAKILTLGK